MKYLFLILLLPAYVWSEYPLKNGVFDKEKYESKGHFYLKEHNGRTIFVTPDGDGFYPIGINHLNIAERGLKGESTHEKSILQNMQKWGFNSGGYGTGEALIAEGVYYIANLNIVKHGFYHLNKVQFPDVFSPSFETHVEEVIKKAAKKNDNPKQLIGVVWSDLPSWNIFMSRMLRQTDWVTEIRKLNDETNGKKTYLHFLKKQYENREEDLKSYYNLKENDLKNLESFDFSKLYLGHPMVMKDDQLFMTKIAEMYYRLGAKYHKKYFGNIPLLGDRLLLGDHPDGVLKVASEYVDVISMQIGDGYGETMEPSFPYPQSTIDHIYKVTKKPILIADHQISFYTKDYKNTIFSQAGDEAQASSETNKFLKASFSTSFVCGYFRCTYLTKSEPNGRGVKQGIVDFDRNPYKGITEAYANQNIKILELINN